MVIDGLHLGMLRGVLLIESGKMALELLDHLLLRRQLILHHVEILDALLGGRVVLCGHLQPDILLLQRLDLSVQVGEFGLVFLDLLFILGDPFFVLASEFDLVLLQLLDLPLPLVVALGL